MELSFTKVGSTYIADYSASSHFNIHIEGGKRVALFNKTSGENWATVASLPINNTTDVDIAVNRPKDFRFALQEKAETFIITSVDGTIIEGTFPDEPISPDAPDVPSGDIPSGYEEFIASVDGIFSASDGAFYVKL